MIAWLEVALPICTPCTVSEELWHTNLALYIFFGSKIELSVRVVTVLNLCWLTKCLVCKGIIEAQGVGTQ